MKTVTEIRNSFWESFPQFAPFYRSKKRQNDYSTTIRCAFVDYLDSLAKDGQISDALASRATL